MSKKERNLRKKLSPTLTLFYTPNFPKKFNSYSQKKYKITIGIGGNIGNTKYLFDKLILCLKKDARFTLLMSSPLLKNPKHQKVYDIVLKAQLNAITNARGGMKASEIDKLTRDVIEKAGFGKYFIHSTGHGVGLDIHEFPNINSKSDVIIEDNMVFTIEPGIYLPNEFGVRIEDTVVMQNGKAVIL